MQVRQNPCLGKYGSEKTHVWENTDQRKTAYFTQLHDKLNTKKREKQIYTQLFARLSFSFLITRKVIQIIRFSFTKKSLVYIRLSHKPLILIA